MRMLKSSAKWWNNALAPETKAILPRQSERQEGSQLNTALTQYQSFICVWFSFSSRFWMSLGGVSLFASINSINVFNSSFFFFFKNSSCDACVFVCASSVCPHCWQCRGPFILHFLNVEQEAPPPSCRTHVPYVFEENRNAYILAPSLRTMILQFTF